MKELNTLVGNVVINLLQREILLNTKRQYMKESNTLVDNAAINLFHRDILLYVLESNTRVSNAINNFVKRVISKESA